MRLGFAILLILTVLAGAARADEDAKSVFEHGTALFALHKYGEAALLFEKAFEMRPEAAILYNAAQAHRLAGNSARALSLYESLLRIYGAKLTNRTEISDHIRELRHAVEAAERATQAPPLTTQHAPAENPKPPPPVVVVEKPAPPPVVVVPPPVVVVEKPISARRRPAWLWGVVGGAAAVVVIVAVGLGVGLGVQPADPKASFGGIMVH